MWPLNKAKKTATKASMQSAVTTANSAGAVAPNSQIASLANSQAASAAVAELTAGLDFVFDNQLAGEGEPGDLVQLHLGRLAEEAAKYPGSQLSEGASEDWTCSHATSRFLQAACRCSSLVYDPSEHPSFHGLQMDPVLHRTPSVMGTVKAASMWKIDDVRIPGWTGKTLMVSIRGTATKADHMVNMNGDPKDASCILKLDEAAGIQAHAGFLACAKALLLTLKRDIADQLAVDDTISNIVLTGHSAGGAVASLIFLHFVSAAESSSSAIKYSLITFGSAPVTSQGITKQQLLLNHKIPNNTIGLMMAFVNEYDMVSRADKAYLRSILDLYRSRYGLPPRWSPPDPGIGATANIVPKDERVDISNGIGGMQKASGDTWPLPVPIFHFVGDIVVLRIDFNDVAPMPGDGDSGGNISVNARSISHQSFCNLLFCDIGVHRKAVYLERLDMLVRQTRFKEFGSLGRGRGGGEEDDDDDYVDAIEDFTREVMMKLGVD